MGASSEFSTFTKTQWNLVIWVQRFSSLLSIAGSSLILIMLLFQKGRARLAHMQNRLILGMTVMDIVNSIALHSKHEKLHHSALLGPPSIPNSMW